MWVLDTLSSCRYEGRIVHDRYDRNQILLEWIGSDKRVLELGCSTGFFSRHLKDARCQVVGVELDAAAARLAERYCEHVLVADLGSTMWVEGLAPNSFDVVLMGDVLEHVADPLAVLRRVRFLLRDRGRLVISLPNVVHWQARLKILCGRFDYSDSGTLDATHLRFFTCKSARGIIEEAGYRVCRFHPAIGGRMSSHFRRIWQLLAGILPGLFAYQMLFDSERCVKGIS